MINCPKGMYCETPQDMAMCPSGYYCSYKTAKPEIKCLQCGEGATQYERDKYGWVVFGLIFALAIFFIVVVLMKRYNKELIYKFNDLQQRQTDSIRLYVNRKKRQQDQLERIRPQLTLISMRVASLEASQHGDSENKLRSSQATLVTGDKVVFDARKLFDTIDVDSSGDVSFSELNQILELNPIQLTDFVRRMNELAGVSVEADCVTRPTFVKYFLQVLEETSHLNVSPDEAGLIFDEIAAQETSKDGSVSPSNFFTSSMSNYLTDAQINELVKVSACYNRHFSF
jgi:Ca2+-binding EF-hand superfamily protein